MCVFFFFDFMNRSKIFFFQQYPIEAGRMSGSSHSPVFSRDSQKYPGSGRVQRAGRGPFEAGFYSCCERRSKVCTFFWEDFFGRIILGGFFWEDFLGGFFWEEFFGRNYLVEINKELMYFSRF